mmetsp:Transcript_9639/g.25105  ORF Transcript_9639/g.25105 Transcript_9639/m.25105 type:complete len:419 (-) Transcript_9639:56-1312(-)|eukprot:CAMPEP_0174922306 /NCGR_PEP_ID=MMETSP1355-20121228/5783_1 /TAXON_ID=464990 /ORGANISM="Hemiselmis tepida, Strain CCMP443" /LENGTH=418 /DNA_ID=CAMNT_0016167881 /DNA_START=253 /DNA_END=1509 /DNA_ORIENTATION=+
MGGTSALLFLASLALAHGALRTPGRMPAREFSPTLRAQEGGARRRPLVGAASPAASGRGGLGWVMARAGDKNKSGAGYVDVASAMAELKHGALTFGEAIKDFLLGAVSGGVASFSVFPIDMAKTRMQDQRIIEGGQMLYRNAFQTISTVARNEGLPACYSGVLPVVIGSAPEAALQLGGDQAGRNYFTKQLGLKDARDLPLWAELCSGTLAGVLQVIATNPMERIKILQQVGAKGGVVGIVKKLGISGLYQGSSACFLRDMPFGAIYFTTYARTKKYLIAESKKAASRNNGKKGGKRNSVPDEDNFIYALIAGLVAGVPGAGLTVPCDVIKTRMQSGGFSLHSAAGGTTTASRITIASTARSLYQEGGLGAFWRGSGARVGRVAPQLAICLVMFETLQKIFPPSPVPPKPVRKGAKGK